MMLYIILNYLRFKVRFILIFFFNSLFDKEYIIGWFIVFEYLFKIILDNLIDGF